MKQQSFLDMEYGMRKRKTRRDLFLETMDLVIPWDELVECTEAFYPKGERGRPPKDLELMLRMYCLRKWYRLSDKSIEEAAYDSGAMRMFLGVSLADEGTPDSRTIARFRRLLSKNGLDKKIDGILHDALLQNGIRLRRGRSEEAVAVHMTKISKE